MNQVMLQTDGLRKSFTLHLRGGLRIPVLADVSFSVRQGECVVLSGPSGAGKSTLMRSLYANYRAEGGRIWVRHRAVMVDLAAADPRTALEIRRETLGYVSQFLRVVPRVPALDIVAEVLISRGNPCRPTPHGEWLVRLGRQTRLLSILGELTGTPAIQSLVARSNPELALAVLEQGANRQLSGAIFPTVQPAARGCLPIRACRAASASP